MTLSLCRDFCLKYCQKELYKSQKLPCRPAPVLQTCCRVRVPYLVRICLCSVAVRAVPVARLLRGWLAFLPPGRGASSVSPRVSSPVKLC